jgi:hypothetical protein
MAILNLTIHFILPFCHFNFSFFGEILSVRKKGWNLFWHILHFVQHWQIKAV